MLNYANAEFYKVFRRKYLYVTFFSILALAALPTTAAPMWSSPRARRTC